MKVILRNYGIRMTSEQKQVARASASDAVVNRGTSKKPGMPRDLFAQPGPRGVLLNWRLPAGNSSDVSGFRIYKDDENTLFYEVHDSSTTSHFVEATAGASPPTTNFFVSSVNKLGIESPKVQIQSSASTESGAPSLPSSPPTYGTQYTGQKGNRYQQPFI